MNRNSLSKILAVISLSAGMIVLTMDAGIAAIALPYIAEDLAIESSTAVLFMVIYNLVLAMTLLPLASLGEYFGLRRLFVIGLILYLAGAALCFCVERFEFLILARCMQALGAASSLSVAIGLVRALYTAKKLGMGLGINTMAGVTGASLAPVVGGLLISAMSWKWVFAAGAPFAVFSLLFAFTIPELERSRSELNLVGAALCASTLGFFIAGLQSLTTDIPAVWPMLCIAVSVLTGVFLVKHEKTAVYPVLPVDLFAQPALALSIAAAFCAVLSTILLTVGLPFLLVNYGFEAAEIGALLFPYVLATAVCAPMAGMLSDSVSPVILGSVGLTIAIVGLASIAMLDPAPAHHAIAWRMGVCGAGFGLFFSPNARLIVSAVPLVRSASASSLISTTRMSGQALGSTLFAMLLLLGLGDNISLSVFTALLATAALILSAFRSRFQSTVSESAASNS